MKLTIIGSSDAFGSGGRLQTCFHVTHSGGQFLIDCGATAPVGLFRQGIEPNGISTIFLSHLHGDHFGGLVWWLIHALHSSRRTQPLTVVGPAGTEDRFKVAAEAFFPGCTAVERRFELLFISHRDRVPLDVGGVLVEPFLVSHPSGAPAYALRFGVDGKTLSFSGDTEWVENLIPAAEGADVFLCECSAFEKTPPYHLNWRTIEANIDRLGAKRLILTHLGPETLANVGAIRHPRVTLSQDGLEIEI